MKPLKLNTSVDGSSLPRRVRRFRVEWRHKHPMWGEVFASTKAEAVALAKRGEFIKGTVDSDPGEDDWTKVEAEEYGVGS